MGWYYLHRRTRSRYIHVNFTYTKHRRSVGRNSLCFEVSANERQPRLTPVSTTTTVQKAAANGGGKTSRKSQDVVEQPASAPDGAPVDTLTETRKTAPRSSHLVPIETGGKGASTTWGRGGEGSRLGAESDLPHFHGVGGEEGAATRRGPKRESRVDSPTAAAMRAAAVYELPALRETAANKQRRSHQVDTVFALGSRGWGGPS